MIRRIITELEKLDVYLDREYVNLKPRLRDGEIRAFFLVRHANAGKAALAQRYIMREWEPRVSRLISPLNTEEYSKLRNWLGIGKLPGVSKWPQEKKKQFPDYIYEAKVYCDLRDEVKESASSTVREQG